MNDLREAAVEYAQNGWSVFPLLPRSKHPNGKLVPQGYHEASDWAPDCLYWWEREPNGNIGLACRRSGILVLDVDPRHGGDDSIFEEEKRLGPLDTMTAMTATGGEHLFFKHPGDVYNFRKELAPGIDIKDRGYVVLPPSVRDTGVYSWDEWTVPAELPGEWLKAMVWQRPQRPLRGVLSPSDDPLLQIPAEVYAERLIGASVVNGWMTCPFHKEGCERTPSFKVNGTMWACFGCEALAGKQTMGGNLLDLAAMLKNYALPLRGTDLQIVKSEMEILFNVSS